MISIFLKGSIIDLDFKKLAISFFYGTFLCQNFEGESCKFIGSEPFNVTFAVAVIVDHNDDEDVNDLMVLMTIIMVMTITSQTRILEGAKQFKTYDNEDHDDFEDNKEIMILIVP